MSSLLRELWDRIGETVTIFTESGGASGCGFTGTLIGVNECFVRLLTEEGTAPASPLTGPDCNGNGDLFDKEKNGHNDHRKRQRVGSVCDIPIDKIVSFCHNAV